MKFLKYLLPIAILGLSIVSCQKDLDPMTGKKPNSGGSGSGSGSGINTEEVSYTPAPCDNKVVAHRGGSKECQLPDNSRVSLRYAMRCRCYASECDIYWTKDNNIVVAHADGTGKINGLFPFESTITQLRKAGKLTNGEELPTLEDFLDIVMVEGNCTKLMLDIKFISGQSADYPSKAVKRACEIIKEKKGEKFCEFICTGSLQKGTDNKSVPQTAAECMSAYNIPVGWMGNTTPKDHKSLGFTWANLSAANYMTPYGSGTRTIKEFKDAGMEISVFNVDRFSGDANAVYSDEAVNYYVSKIDDLRCICTNYPYWLIKKFEEK